MDKPIKLLVVDDHILFRKGLVQLMSACEQFQVCAEAANGKEALALLKSQAIDVVVLDLSMPEMDGLTMLKQLRAAGRNTPVLILSISDDFNDVITAINLGANGFILKSEEFDFLSYAIERVYQGGFVLSIELLGGVFRAIRYKTSFPTAALLSKRELEVLIFLHQDLKIEEIASRLFVSENTIKTHLKHIYSKMEVNNRTEAVEKGVAWGLLA